MRLTEGDTKPLKLFGSPGGGIGGFARISRRNVASFLIDTPEKDEWDMTTHVIAN